jgi:hypothetical protein
MEETCFQDFDIMKTLFVDLLDVLRHGMFATKLHNVLYEGVSKSFRTESKTKYTLTFGITR